jgi:NADH dehydrogenase FAD-containing subunit
MRHRITVLGAGYAGASAAGYLARHLHPADFEITVVNAEADFVERIRLHQLAAGQDRAGTAWPRCSPARASGCGWVASPRSTPGSAR